MQEFGFRGREETYALQWNRGRGFLDSSPPKVLGIKKATKNNNSEVEILDWKLSGYYVTD